MNARTLFSTSEGNAVKYGRVSDAQLRYGLGKATVTKLANEARATVKVGRCLLINFELLDSFIDGKLSTDQATGTD